MLTEAVATLRGARSAAAPSNGPPGPFFFAHTTPPGRGTWRPPGPHSRNRGRGTAIMEALTDHLVRDSGPDGTVVSLAVSPPRVGSGQLRK